jgi:AcrR family transcriptional regulator
MTDQSANQDKHQRIIRAARELFSEKDFHEVTVEEVSEQAGVGKGTVYLYFPSKESLFVEVIHDGILELRGEVEHSLRGVKKPAEKIEKIVEINLTYLERNESFFKAFARGEVQLRGLLTEIPLKQLHLLDHQMKLLTQIIQEGVESGDFKPVDPKIAALALQGIIVRLALMHVVGEINTKLLDLRNLVTSLFLHGIKATGG